jgi:hypothetical protein
MKKFLELFIALLFLFILINKSFADIDNTELHYNDSLLPNISKSTFNKLKINMSLKKVIKTLGKPPLYCREKDGKINQINFYSDQIISCHWEGKSLTDSSLPTINININNGKIYNFTVVTNQNVTYSMSHDGTVSSSTE